MHLARSKLWAIVRLIAAGAVAAAVITQFIYGSQFDSFSAANFFSYFTILSNIFIAIVLIKVAVLTLCGKKLNVALESARGAATLYMVTTGIIFAVLLSHYPLGLTLPWVNSVLHQIIPVFAALDWLLAPPQVRLKPRSWWMWLLFPLLYGVYSLLRGPHVGWYPYPFLNPTTQGYGRVAVSCIGIAIFLILLMGVIGWAGNYLGGKTRHGPR